MPKLDLSSIPQINSTSYPGQYAGEVQQRWFRRLAPVAGITDFGASHVVLKPGGWSAQRHWHEEEDELVIMLSGEAVLIDDNGRTPMRAGDIAVFPKGDGNGHCLVNESEQDCSFVAIGRVSQGDCHYPDIDLHLFTGKGFRRKDGTEF